MRGRLWWSGREGEEGVGRGAAGEPRGLGKKKEGVGERQEGKVNVQRFK